MQICPTGLGSSPFAPCLLSLPHVLEGHSCMDTRIVLPRQLFLWVAVKELQVSYNDPEIETVMFITSPQYMVIEIRLLNSSPVLLDPLEGARRPEGSMRDGVGLAPDFQKAGKDPQRRNKKTQEREPPRP